MIYLKSFTFPTEEQESPMLDNVMTKWHNTVYPFKIASGGLLQTLKFAPVTILYGSNGSGKTTLLNVMAQKLGVECATPFNTSTFFDDYLGLCTYEARGDSIPLGSRIITSDDVFDFVLNRRIVNSGIDDRREQLIAEYLELNVGDNWRISEGKPNPELPMQILPVTMQETVYGELHWQNSHVSSSEPLLNSVSSMLGRGLYFNQAQKHFQQLLLMEERATIARELHDSLAQVLSYLRIQLTLLKRSIPEDNATAQSIMADFSQALNDAYRQLRELLTTFRLTLQQADLPSALREMLDTLQNQTSAKLTLDCRLPTLALDAQMQVHLLQIIREAVLNAMKHANASEIAVSCVTAPDGNHTVYIRDNGIGIGEPKEPEGHYGLNIMRERAERLGGTLTFSQPSGGGTLVSISFRSAEGEESQLM